MLEEGTHTHDKIWNNLIEEHIQKIVISAILGNALHRGTRGLREEAVEVTPQFLPTSSNFVLGEFSDEWM